MPICRISLNEVIIVQATIFQLIITFTLLKTDQPFIYFQIQ